MLSGHHVWIQTKSGRMYRMSDNILCIDPNDDSITLVTGDRVRLHTGDAKELVELLISGEVR